MQITALFLTLLGASASALPTIAERGPVPPTDGRGATIFSEQNYGGTSGAIPPSSYCTDLNNVFFDMDGKTRSMIVEGGMWCTFYIDHGCPEKGYGYAFGDKKISTGQAALPKWLDRTIHSVRCQPL